MPLHLHAPTLAGVLYAMRCKRLRYRQPNVIRSATIHGKRLRLKQHSANLLAGLIWTAPWWLGFLLFLAIPMAFSLYISFCDYTLLLPPVYTGASNYVELTRDALFWKVVWNTLVFAAISVPVSTILAVLIAVLLNQPVKGQALVRACVFGPTLVPLVVAGLVWMWMLNPTGGLINSTFQAATGIEGPASLITLPFSSSIARTRPNT